MNSDDSSVRRSNKVQAMNHEPRSANREPPALTDGAAAGSAEQAGSPLGTPSEERATAQAVQNMFARVARRYDLLNHLLSVGFDLWWRRSTAAQARSVLERPGSIAADLCCGTGDLTFALARLSAGRVIGADFCQPMLEIAHQK